MHSINRIPIYLYIVTIVIIIFGKCSESAKPALSASAFTSDPKFDRWLRVNNGKKRKALSALKKNEAWRAKNNPQGTLTENFGGVENSFQYKFSGVDRHDRPIMISQFGKWDVTRNDARSYRYIIKWFESMEHVVDIQSAKLGKPITQVTAIHDMTGFSPRFFTPKGIKYLIKMLRIYDKNYAGVMQKEYCINSPRYLPFWISLIKPFMTKETASHLRILGTDKREWKQALLEDIDQNVIDQLFP